MSAASITKSDERYLTANDGDQHSFERLLTSAIAAILTIIFSWRILLEEDKRRALAGRGDLIMPRDVVSMNGDVLRSEGIAIMDATTISEAVVKSGSLDRYLERSLDGMDTSSVNNSEVVDEGNGNVENVDNHLIELNAINSLSNTDTSSDFKYSSNIEKNSLETATVGDSRIDYMEWKYDLSPFPIDEQKTSFTVTKNSHDIGQKNQSSLVKSLVNFEVPMVPSYRATIGADRLKEYYSTTTALEDGYLEDSCSDTSDDDEEDEGSEQNFCMLETIPEENSDDLRELSDTENDDKASSLIARLQYEKIRKTVLEHSFDSSLSDNDSCANGPNSVFDGGSEESGRLNAKEPPANTYLQSYCDSNLPKIDSGIDSPISNGCQAVHNESSTRGNKVASRNGVIGEMKGIANGSGVNSTLSSVGKRSVTSTSIAAPKDISLLQTIGSKTKKKKVPTATLR